MMEQGAHPPARRTSGASAGPAPLATVAWHDAECAAYDADLDTSEEYLDTQVWA